MAALPIPSGLVGVEPRDPIGVVVTVGRKDQRTGAPTDKQSLFLMSPQTASKEFASGGGKPYKSLARSPHPAFAAWNDAAAKGSERCRTLRGNLVHARLQDAVFWNRAAQKLPEPHPNPASQRPACEGNGVVAIRYSGVTEGDERYPEIACPNELCPFAMSGTCKPFGSLLFRLRWADDRFPELLAYWSTRGWNSLRNLLGLFELVVGTKAVAPWEPEESWMPGLCEGAGIPAEDVSLFGLPFVLTVGEKTRASDERTPGGRRFPVVSFSPDGDLMQWLVLQAKQRQLAGGRAVAALPAAAMGDPDVEAVRHEARLEFDPAAVIEVPPARQNAPAASPAAPGPTIAPGGGEGAAYLDETGIEALFKEADKLKVPREALAGYLDRNYSEERNIPAGDRSLILTWLADQARAKGAKR